MCASNQSIEPYYMQFLHCAKCSHVFEYESRSYHPITLPTCDHTMCKQCISIICNETKCPLDQVSFEIDHTPIDQLPINFPLLIILYDPLKLPQNHQERYGQCPSYIKSDDETKIFFNSTEKFLGDISIMIKPILNSKECESVLTRRLKLLQAIRSLGEHICFDFIFAHQNSQQLTNNVWSVVGFQNHKFYEPIMQEKVLNLILSFFKSHEESRCEDIVSFILKEVHGKDRQDVRHIINVLSGASCFNIKQERNYSLMQLKQELDNFESLRTQYHMKIIQIGIQLEMFLCIKRLYMSSQDWSKIFYGDTQHDLKIQSVIDKLTTPESFNEAIKQYTNVVTRAGRLSCHLLRLEERFTTLSKIDAHHGQYYLDAPIFKQLVDDIIELVTA